MVDTKNEMLDYMKIMELNLINMLFTPSVVRKINNANYKGYVNKNLNKEMEMNILDTRHTEAILDSFQLKRLERIGGNTIRR